MMNVLSVWSKRLSLIGISVILAGCASESHRSIEPTRTASSGSVYHGPKSMLAVGKFNNNSQYMRGLFSDGIDRLGNQAKTILLNHLQQTGRFTVLDRDNMEEMAAEAGDVQLFGILGSGKKQVAYTKVTLNVVDVLTSGVVYSVQGAGEYTLSNREILGTGSAAGYDSTLNGKVLDLAVREAVDHLVEGIQSGAWGVAGD